MKQNKPHQVKMSKNNPQLATNGHNELKSLTFSQNEPRWHAESLKYDEILKYNEKMY